MSTKTPTAKDPVPPAPAKKRKHRRKAVKPSSPNVSSLIKSQPWYAEFASQYQVWHRTKRGPAKDQEELKLLRIFAKFGTIDLESEA